MVNNHFPRSPVSLYFHIPFCSRKCDYCHFYVLPDKESYKIQLMEALMLEWQLLLPKLRGHQISTIYFGGGTPALLGPNRVAQILEWVKNDIPFQDPNIEITLEANPENITLPLMQAYLEAGINRVSIGVQTLDDTQLQVLSRGHSALKARQSIELTSEAGFKNISIDLMYDLPGQTLQSWERTLKQASLLPITHLSLYNLTIEPHTVFFKYRETLNKQIPDAECSLKMYEMAIQTLEERGLMQYEISAFSQPFYSSRHNVGYWTARPFFGLGPSAFSYWEGKRFRNIANLSKYSQALKSQSSPVDFLEELSPDAQRRELLAINLRLKEGVNLKAFQKANGVLSDETRVNLKKLEDDGLLTQEGEFYRLTNRGVLFYDSVAVELI